MKIIIIILFVLNLIVSNIFAQKELDFIEVRINSGYTIFGNNSFKLLREGFVYRKHNFLLSKNEEIKFVPIYNLDLSSVMAIQNYIVEMELITIEELLIPDTVIISHSSPIRISFINLSSHKYNTFLYMYCDERIDTLIKLMNNLIPDEDKENFLILHRCH